MRIPARFKSGSEAATRALSCLLFICVLLLYLITLTRNFYWDGIDFAWDIEAAAGPGAALFHPNHLIYNFIGYFAYHICAAAGVGARALTALQLVNCVLGALSVVLFFRVLLAGLKSLYLSLALTALFACAATWWKYATDADSYVASVCLLIICLHLVLPGRRPRALPLAAAHAAAMLFHQLALFAAPALLFGLWRQTANRSRQRRWLTLAQYAITAGGLTAAAYCAAFYLLTKSLPARAFARWLTNYSPEHGFSFAPWGNLVHTLRGHVRLFAGGRMTLLSGLVTPPVVVLIVLLVAVVLLLGYLLARYGLEFDALRHAARVRDGRLGELRALCLFWIAPYLAFLFIFIPQNTFYRLLYLPPLILLAGTLLAPIEAQPTHTHRYRLALLVAALALSNLVFFIYPYTHTRNNPPLALALELGRRWPAGTVVYYASSSTDNRLCRYFSPAAVWRQLPPGQLEEQERELRTAQAGGAEVWLDVTALDRLRTLPAGGAWLAQHTTGAPRVELLNDKYRLQFVRLNPAP